MRSPKAGFFTFIHHDIPIEYSQNIQERLRFIDNWKPAEERRIRKRCIIPVPKQRLPKAYLEAWKAYDETNKAYDEVEKAFDEAREAAYDKTKKAFLKAREAYREAEWAFLKAGEACYDDLLNLALELVPDAPWDKGKKCLIFATKKGGL